MSTPNASPPPDWYLQQDKGPSILAAIITVTVIGTIFTVARLYVRHFIRGGLRVDDYLILVSMLCGYVSVAFGVLAVKSGNGKHFVFLDTEQKEGVIFWTMVGFVPGIFSFALPKLAVVVLLTHLLSPSRRHRVILWTMTGLCVTALNVAIFTLFFQCSPPSSQWDLSITNKHCISKWIHIDYSIAVGAYSAFVDLYLAFYPTVVLFKLQMSMYPDLDVYQPRLFMYALLCIRVSRIWNILLTRQPDDCPDLIVWTVVEGNSLITATCIPILKPLGDKILGSRAFSRNDSKPRYYDPDSKDPIQTIGSGDMELANQSRRRRRCKKGSNDPDADLLVTTCQDRAETESQEEILAADQKQVQEKDNERSARELQQQHAFG
ncbi:hypothetical protein PG993_000037 [Apiospora rasikravindrae]|uniref:Rhodopsin domain-containing protein n=1 Tax=Apiospora rasikravindrae TaxID=990691 RepID=A0ABR1U7C5_9PEZI